MATSSPAKPTVFISYSHKDEAWKDLLRPHLGVLEKAGRIDIWDDRDIDTGSQWFDEIKEAMERAAVAVCLISADYLSSDFCVKEEIPYLLERRENDGMILIPVLVRPCAWKAVPWLKKSQLVPRDGKSISRDFSDNGDEVFADVAEFVFEKIENPEFKLPPQPSPVWSLPDRIEINRLPLTGGELFGRQKELALLDQAWDSSNRNIVSLVAWGGVGKSTLVNKWLELMKADNYRGASRIYAWSFYSQGTGERVTSADQFINHALSWFGDPDPSAGSSWDKGERLAKLIQSEKTLLILDGLEPLQSGQPFERGKLKEPALVTLLTELARQNSGLCLIATRERVTDLEHFGEEVLQEDLEQISDEAGRSLLRVGGVQGTDAELEEATRNFGNHALAISLLTVYLRDIPGHVIANAENIPDLDVPEKEGKHPRRLMAALAERLGNGPELEVLGLLGLFDRPADNASLRALRKAPAISGLTEHLRKLTEAGWSRTTERLRNYRLIARRSVHRPNDLDAHPLVRDHFRTQLKTKQPDAWKGGNYRLFRYYKTIAKGLPSTIEEMTPLYAAVAHACAAGRYEEALYKVYIPRIQRVDKAFNARRLGAHSAELSALSGFFDVPWLHPVQELNRVGQAYVLNEAGYDLRMLGKLIEAASSTQAALKIFSSLGIVNNNTARCASSVSDIYLALGDLQQALYFAEVSVKYAEKSGGLFEQLATKSTVGGVLHQVGRLTDAGLAFSEAEKTQKEKQPWLPYLYSLQGYQYADFLLDVGEYANAQERAAYILEAAISHSDAGFIDIGLGHLLLARSHLFQNSDQVPFDSAAAAEHLKDALHYLRQAATTEMVLPCLLAHAKLHRLDGNVVDALGFVEEAIHTAQRSNMRLHEIDGHLEYARLYLRVSENHKELHAREENNGKARHHWNTAKEMIDETGYHRRDKDVKEIKEILSR